VSTLDLFCHGKRRRRRRRKREGLRLALLTDGLQGGLEGRKQARSSTVPQKEA
jgi:hypothetical protein